MKCPLGEKKCRVIERLTGRSVRAAYVRGGWEHFVSKVYFRDGGTAWVNYKTGETEQITAATLPPQLTDDNGPRGAP